MDNFGILAYVQALIADNFGISAHIKALIADDFGIFNTLGKNKEYHINIQGFNSRPPGSLLATNSLRILQIKIDTTRNTGDM